MTQDGPSALVAAWGQVCSLAPDPVKPWVKAAQPLATTSQNGVQLKKSLSAVRKRAGGMVALLFNCLLTMQTTTISKQVRCLLSTRKSSRVIVSLCGRLV